MGVRLNGLLGLLTLVVASAMFAGTASAQTATDQTEASQTETSQTEPRSLRDAFSRAYYSYDGNFFSNRGVVGQLNWIFGPFIENEITSDGRAVDRIYQDGLRQQSANDPTIRTADLENPYDTSLLLLPSTSAASSLSTGSEIVPQAPLAAPPAPPAPQPAAPEQPIPGLW